MKTKSISHLALTLALASFLSLPAHAQPAPILPETTTVGLESIPVEPEAEAPEEIIGTLILSDESAIQVLDLLEQLTGKIILRRQDIPPVKINFNSRGEITKGEAVLALESLLTLNSIMLTDMGGKFMKAVPATDVNRHVPEMLMSSTLDLPASQQIYAKLFQLDYLNAEQASGTIISPLLSQNSSFIAFPKSNAILITDALLNLQRIERILDQADRPQAVRETIEFIKLDFVQAREMKEQLENLIKGPLQSYLEGSTSVTADERTNQLIIISHPGNMEMIMNVVENVDVDAAPLTSSEVFQLRQAKAEEVVPIIENIISGQKEGREEDAKVTRENGTNAPGNTANNNANAQPNIPTVPTAPAVAAAVTEANSSLQFSNFVGLSADERTNSIVAYGTQQDLKTLKQLIEKIDIPLPQVLIEAIITQVTLSEDQASGLGNLSFSFDGATHTFTEIALGTAAGISISDGIIDIDNPDDFSLSTSITPNNTDSDTRVLSTPRIIVSHNEEGVINVSRSQPIITSSTNYTNSDGTTRSSVEYRDIGIQLTVTPLIGVDGTVQMVIEQTIENVIETVQIDGNDQPVIGKREATSTVSVKDGQIIVLGGLQENTLTSGNSYFPIIGRLPVINKILGSSSNNYDRTEIIIFIRPKILTNPTEADRLANEYFNVIEEKDAVKEYLETDTTGDLYMEGSKFEKDKTLLRKLRWPDL
ncbi:secretin N-terminal domain-containing protein [Coraliomargarita parva]|uniref:secretin N-terminal domain-containing protein n=1 Tax=Coraliomargarita parva TaxID=3014050 RepID=UPI0022B43F9B|nr:secretin N-terminal domain-containing protein [Coraliomargarita parva]